MPVEEGPTVNSTSCCASVGDSFVIATGPHAGLLAEVVAVDELEGRARVRLVGAHQYVEVECWELSSAGFLTEEEWREGTCPARLECRLRLPSRRFSARRWALLACACARRLWPLLKDEAARKALEVAERYAEGQARWRELRALARAIKVEKVAGRAYVPNEQAALVAIKLTVEAVRSGEASELSAARRACATAEPGQGALLAQCDLIRDLFEPYRPVTLERAWRRWNNGAVVGLASVIHAERRYDEVAVLGDALEEAGCTEGPLLAHCRSERRHTLGCWAVDTIIGKE
jgi:hypothetical protein